MKLQEDTPIFGKQHVRFSPPHQMTHLVVNNNRLVLAMANKSLLRINLLQNPDDHEGDYLNS